MWKKLRGILKYSLLTAFLIAGMMCCAVGVTWCRYQVRQNYEINFTVREPGSYYITNVADRADAGVWKYDSEKDCMRTDFMVTNGIENYPDEDTFFCLRLLATEGVTLQPEVRLIITDMGGRETEYVGVPKSLSESDEETKELYSQVGTGALYRFFDEDGKELILELEGGKISSQICTICVAGVPESFLAELMVLDSSYALEQIRLNTIHLQQQFNVTSNYLTAAGNTTVLLDNWTVGNTTYPTADITLTAEGTATAGNISCSTSSEYITAELEWLTPIPEGAVTGSSQTVIFDEAGTKSLRLKINPVQDKVAGLTESVNATVKVVWNITEPQAKTLSANFRVTINPSGNSGDSQTEAASVLDLVVPSGKETFSQDSPLRAIIKTDGTYDLVKLQNGSYLFAAKTRYSLDDGQTWYVLSKDGTIDIPVKKIEQIVEDTVETDTEDSAAEDDTTEDGTTEDETTEENTETGTTEELTTEESTIESETPDTVYIMIDISESAAGWYNGAYTISGTAYYNGNAVATDGIAYSMQDNSVTVMSVATPEGMPIVSDQKTWYADVQYGETGADSLTYTTERLTSSGYREIIADDGLNIVRTDDDSETSSRITISAAEGMSPAAGTYRITFIQTYNGTEVTRKTITFFVNYRYGN